MDTICVYCARSLLRDTKRVHAFHACLVPRVIFLLRKRMCAYTDLISEINYATWSQTANHRIMCVVVLDKLAVTAAIPALATQKSVPTLYSSKSWAHNPPSYVQRHHAPSCCNGLTRMLSRIKPHHSSYILSLTLVLQPS